MNQNGKGSARRKENFKAVQENWDEIKWVTEKFGKPFKVGTYAPAINIRSDGKKISACCGSHVWVEGSTTLFYVCGNCDHPCDTK